MEELKLHVKNIPSHWKDNLQFAIPYSKSSDKQRRFHPNFLLYTNPKDGSKIVWNSRKHRKGRSVKTSSKQKETKSYSWISLKPKSISWWVGVLFILGSIAWVVNGFVVFLPLITSKVKEDLLFAGISALVGGTLFEIGAYIAYVEALNVERDINIDKIHEIEHDIENPKELTSLQKGKEMNRDQPNFSDQNEEEHKIEEIKKEENDKIKKSTIWFGFRFNEIGFQAAFIQMISATIFWVSTFTGIPGVINEESVGQVQGSYWTPQVVGGTGFIISSLISMYEVQPKWYKLKPLSAGWQTAFWNLVGAVGFTLCGVFGYFGFEGRFQTWGMAFSTFWGGWAFLIGSYILWWESFN